MKTIDRVRVRALDGASQVERAEALAVEEPLEIRIRPEGQGETAAFVTTMRTPGRDEDLAAGLLFSEGVLAARADLLALGRPTNPRVDPELRANVIEATLASEALGRARGLARQTVMGSACGVCGKTSIERVLPEGASPLASTLAVPAGLLYGLPEKLHPRQSVFAETGGLHAAALFTADGTLEDIAEDIGRHNAADKLVGACWLEERLPLSESILMVSGRAGFEIVQKAFGAGIPIVCSVSAPSSLAVALAEAAGLTLVGFLRGRRFNIYAHPRRIAG